MMVGVHMIEQDFLKLGNRVIVVRIKIDGEDAFYKRKTWKTVIKRNLRNIFGVLEKVGPAFSMRLEEENEDGKVIVETRITKENQWLYQMLYENLKETKTRVTILK